MSAPTSDDLIEAITIIREMLNDDDYQLGDESLLPEDHPKARGWALLARLKAEAKS